MVDLNLNGVKTRLQLGNPPLDAEALLDSMIDMGK